MKTRITLLLLAVALMLGLPSCRSFSPWEVYRSANI
jgi:hypothetical protein